MFLKYHRVYVAFYHKRLHWDKPDILDKSRVTKKKVGENKCLDRNAEGKWENGFSFERMQAFLHVKLILQIMRPQSCNQMI